MTQFHAQISMLNSSVITYADDNRVRSVVSGVCVSVCLSVCRSVFYMISQNQMQLGSPHLTQKCSTIIPKNPFILGSKSQRSRSFVRLFVIVGRGPAYCGPQRCDHVAVQCACPRRGGELVCV